MRTKRYFIIDKVSTLAGRFGNTSAAAIRLLNKKNLRCKNSEAGEETVSKLPGTETEFAIWFITD